VQGRSFHSVEIDILENATINCEASNFVVKIIRGWPVTRVHARPLRTPCPSGAHGLLVLAACQRHCPIEFSADDSGANFANTKR
jgi:hypothetical protein